MPRAHTVRQTSIGVDETLRVLARLGPGDVQDKRTRDRGKGTLEHGLNVLSVLTRTERLGYARADVHDPVRMDSQMLDGIEAAVLTDGEEEVRSPHQLDAIQVPPPVVRS